MDTRHHARSADPGAPKSFWRTPLGWAFAGFAAIAAFFLVAEHSAHLLGWIPWLLILACPLMHFLGHGGHRHGRRDDRDEPAGKGGEPLHRH